MLKLVKEEVGIMKKREIWLKICAILLTICFALTSATAVQIIKVYAEEYETEDLDDVDPEPDVLTT